VLVNLLKVRQLKARPLLALDDTSSSPLNRSYPRLI